MSAYAGLNRRRQRFVDEYVLCGVGTDAIKKAGYRGRTKGNRQHAGDRADAAASRYLSNPDVQAAIAERTAEAIAKAGARQVKFVEELCLLAYASLSQLRGEDGKPLTFEKLPQELLAAAEAVEFDTAGKVTKIKLSKVPALRMLGDLMKLLPQTHELTGKGGAPIETREVSQLEVARRIAFLLTQGMRSAPESSDPAE